MLLLIAVLIMLAAALIVARMRARAGVNPADLGQMSEQWLAEYRASHP